MQLQIAIHRLIRSQKIDFCIFESKYSKKIELEFLYLFVDFFPFHQIRKETIIKSY